MSDIMKEYVLITGAASDIGAAIAIKLSEKYNLLLTDIDEQSLDAVAEKCKKHTDVKSIVIKLDDADSIEKVLTDCLETQDITVSKFVHCAGIAKQVPLKMVKSDDFVNSFKVNAISPAMIIKVLSSRKNHKALDSCVLIASVAALRGVKAFSVYGSTKAAIIGLVNNLAIELAPKVRVNAISPGSIKTRNTEKIIGSRESEISMKYPLGIGAPNNLIGAVAFLLSDEAKWITGQNLVIDGGRTIDGTD